MPQCCASSCGTWATSLTAVPLGRDFLRSSSFGGGTAITGSCILQCMSTYGSGAMHRYQNRMTVYYWTRTGSHVVLVLSTSLGMVLASLNWSSYAGILMVCAASVSAWTEFSGTTKKLTRYSSVVNQLQDVLHLWESLSDTQRSSTTIVRQLIEGTENILRSELDSWIATSPAAKMLAKLTEESNGPKSKGE